MKELFGLEGKTVVMTGASGGVGSASARLFAREAGARVALISRRGAAPLAAELSSQGYMVRSFNADVCDDAQLESVFSRIVAEMGPIHSLLNISGVCDFYPASATPQEKTKVDNERWDKIVSVNGRGVLLTIQYACESMPAGGSIVNVASTAGRFGAEMAVIDYTFAKAGVLGVTRGYAKILGERGIRVNAVAPGPIEDTEMLAGVDTAALAELKAQTKLGRLCKPGDIARVNLFLASDLSSVVTGTTIDANCGQYFAP